MANPSADYPTAIHTPTDISAFEDDTLGETSPTHADVHGKVEEEIEEIQKKLGIGASNASSATEGQVLTKQGDGSTAWATPPASGGGVPQIIVAANGAPSAWADAADYTCDGTADNVQIQEAIDDALAEGGEVILSPGDFAISASLEIAGSDDYQGPQVIMRGQGQEVTRLVGASNVDVIALSNSARVVLADFTIQVAGSGDAILSTASGATLNRGFHWSMFKNIYIVGSTHTGWGMSLENPFRSTFENIEMFDVDNGLFITAPDSDFNPGDCTFTRMFIELNSNSSGVGLHLNSPTSGGSVNQIIFDMVEMFDNGSGGTGILLDGAVGSNHNIFRGINVEQFATATLNLTTGYGNRFSFNHVTPPASSSFVIFGSGSNGNKVERTGFLFVDGGTVTVVNDGNTDTDNPNFFEDAYLGVESGATAAATITPATIIRDMRGYNSGTLAAALAFHSNGLVTYPHIVNLTDGATPALDASLGNHFRLTAAGNRTIAVPSNPRDGQKIVIEHIASGGARTLALNTGTGGFAFGADITGLTETDSGETDLIGAIYNASANKWRVVAYVKGY